MLHDLETGIGLDVVLALQELRNGTFDTLVELLDIFGEQFFYIALIGLIFWIFNKHLGGRAFLTLAVVTFAIVVLKDILGRPRPFTVSDEVVQVVPEHGNGLPSGHTGMTLALYGYIAYWLKSRAVGLFAVVYLAIQAFGRMYAGVHYPQDILGGLLVGGAILAGFISLSDEIGNRWQTIPTTIRIIVLSGFALVGLAIFADQDILTVVGLFVGGVLGLMWENSRINFQPPTETLKRIAFYIIGVFATIGTLILLDQLFGEHNNIWIDEPLRVIRYSGVALVALGLVPWIGIRSGLVEKE